MTSASTVYEAMRRSSRRAAGAPGLGPDIAQGDNGVAQGDNGGLRRLTRLKHCDRQHFEDRVEPEDAPPVAVLDRYEAIGQEVAVARRRVVAEIEHELRVAPHFADRRLVGRERAREAGHDDQRGAAR